MLDMLFILLREYVMLYMGIMTGNSLDAVDLVLTDISNGIYRDILNFSRPYPAELTTQMLELRKMVKAAAANLAVLEKNEHFIAAIKAYTRYVGEAVNACLEQNNIKPAEIKAIGFHGQTLDHYPPSIASKDSYTLQVGDAQLLADMTNIPVVYDFRSDDIFNGGEGAPLAPMHNQHLAESLFNRCQNQNLNSVAFCNAGNTGNIAVVAKGNDDYVTLGWDVGPFNHFADMLTRQNWQESCDKNGKYGSQGEVKPAVIETLYHQSAANEKGTNFYEIAPPKSSDPSWYQLPKFMPDEKPCDVLRSVEYFSAYNFALSLRFVPQNVEFPQKFLLFGGGWNNPLCSTDFKNILQNRHFEYLLKEHKGYFNDILKRLPQKYEIVKSDAYGINGQFMEARIFADLAHCYFEKIPFCFPQITGCCKPTICGICAFPGDNECRMWSRAAKYQKN